MNLDDFLGPKPQFIDLRSEDSRGAIVELVEHLASKGKIKPEQKESIASAVKKREDAMSTGIGYGIAIPHASTNLVTDLVVAIGRSLKGIKFNAVDSQPVKLVLLFLVPAGQMQKHVNTLANIAKLLHSQDFRDGFWRRFLE